MIDPLHSISGYYNYNLNIETAATETKDQEEDFAVQNEVEKKDQNNLNSEKEKNKTKANELSEEEKKQIETLEQRDQEVKTHEQAHLAAAGGYAIGGAQYEYTQGPDGKQYVINGHVNIDTSAESTPEETLKKAQTIRSAALAPSEPSGQDMKVAAQASELAAEAQKDLRENPSGENNTNNPTQAIPETGETDTNNSHNPDQESNSKREENGQKPETEQAEDLETEKQNQKENNNFNQFIQNAYTASSANTGNNLSLIA